MRIAIPLDNNQLAEEFSRSSEFALFDVHDQTRAVNYLGRQTFATPGCGKTPTFLRQHEVEVVLGHRVSEKATNHLLEVGIVAIKDAPILSADALIAHLVSGTLQATPPDAAMHGGGCQSGGGCGHCSSQAHTHEDHDHAAEASSACGHHHEHAAESCGDHNCGSQAQQSSSCCGGQAQSEQPSSAKGHCCG